MQKGIIINYYSLLQTLDDFSGYMTFLNAISTYATSTVAIPTFEIIIFKYTAFSNL